MFGVSHELLTRLNPGVDRLVIDNASPLDPRRFATGCDYYHLKDSIGHFSPTYATERVKPKDGPGRAHTYAWQIAASLGYQRTFYCEADCLFAHPAEWGFAQMTKRIGAQPGVPAYGYKFDWHVVWVADIQWFVHGLKFPEKYGWETRTRHPAGEVVYQEIMGEEVQELPVRGIRGETVGLNETNYREHFPDGCDLITHAPHGAQSIFLNDIGHADLVEKL